MVSCYLDTGCGAFTCLKAVPAWLSTFSVFFPLGYNMDDVGRDRKNSGLMLFIDVCCI